MISSISGLQYCFTGSFAKFLQFIFGHFSLFAELMELAWASQILTACAYDARFSSFFRTLFYKFDKDLLK